jgi:hypothetical protein
MSEFDKLKDDAEQYAKDHPQQVHEAEQGVEHAVEKELGVDRGQAQDNPRDPGSQQDLADQQAPGDDRQPPGDDRGQGFGQQDQDQ